MNRTELGSYLGIWGYKSSATSNFTKYFKVVPIGDKFEITWGTTLKSLDTPQNRKLTVVDSQECYKRILSKARAGFVLKTPYEGILTAKSCQRFESIEDVLTKESSEALKRKPRKRSISLIDWMDGLTEERADEER